MLEREGYSLERISVCDRGLGGLPTELPHPQSLFPPQKELGVIS
jgi:hypothetical protein